MLALETVLQRALEPVLVPHEAQAVVLSDGLELVALVQELELERRGLSSSSCPSYPSCPSCSSSLVAVAAAPTPSQREHPIAIIHATRKHHMKHTSSIIDNGLDGSRRGGGFSSSGGFVFAAFNFPFLNP